MDVLVGGLLKGLKLLHLTLWLLRDVCVQTGVLFHSLSGSGGGDSSVYNKYLPTMLKECTSWYAEEGVPNNAISAPKLADSLAHLFRAGLVWCMMCIYHSAISAILELHHHKASNHPIISKLMCHFYLHPSHK